jgi:anti-sigma factor RsiW
MNCEECGPLLHALIDGELDAGHAFAVEQHVGQCGACAAELESFQDLRRTIAAAAPGYRAPPTLRAAIAGRLPAAPRAWPNRRSLLQGFAAGAAASAALAASLALIVMPDRRPDRLRGEILSAHLRSLQLDHLTDVQSSNQHTVKPWFNGRLDVAPPVPDLTAQGFTLLGGRLDYIDGKPVAAIVYRRRTHVINLFVSQAGGAEAHAPTTETVQGFNLRSWAEQGLAFTAISDLEADELREFADKFQAATRKEVTG